MDNAPLDFLTRQDLVDKLKVTAHTIRRWERHEGLPVRIIGAQHYYRLAEVDEWVESHLTSKG